MNRRQMLRYSLGTVAVAAGLSSCTAQGADGRVDYSRELYDEALASGEPFLLDFSATW